MLEFKTLVIPLDPNLEATLQQAAAEGWMIVPGVVPSAIYQLCRMPRPQQQDAPAPMAAFGSFGTLTVDDSKVHILRDGKLLKQGD